MSGRLNLLPDPAFADLRVALSERLERMATAIKPAQFETLLDPLMRQIVERGFREAQADEGTVWLLDESCESLVPAYNTGPDAAKLVGTFRQPLNTGLICMVLASEQPFLENEVHKNASQSKLLDSRLKVQTHAMIAVPFHFVHACRGVISCVQLRRSAADADPAGFRPEHLAAVQRSSALLSQLIEYHLLSRAVGWTSE
jgi:transcriptional regulator with GAF, ATPase, and Fis domain